MEMSQFHYLPLTPVFFSILVGIFGIVFLLLQLGALRYAFLSLGVSARTAMWLLIGSLIGSYFNIPVAVLPAQPVMSDQTVNFFGIAVPVFMPAVITAIVAVLLSRQEAAPLAYIGGGLGTLIGADITNLDKVAGLGAPVASIGGAGTFDGVFLTGILAVLLASLYARPRQAETNRG